MTILRNSKLLALVIGALLLDIAYEMYASWGKVIDGSTGQPLAGVHVIARWDGERLHGIESNRTCFKVDATVTDANGQYWISTNSWNFSPLIFERRRTLAFYKRGYKEPEFTTSYDESRVAMTPDARSGLDRMRYIGWVSNRADCGGREQQLKVAMPYYKAVYEESREMAHSSDELAWLNSAIFRIEELEVGEDKARENSKRREVEWGLK